MTPPLQDSQPERRLHLPRIFRNELRQMMSGFGDHQNPRAETVTLMEEIVLEYITALVTKVSIILPFPKDSESRIVVMKANPVAKSTEVAHLSRRERPDVADIKFIIRKDPRKLKRVRYLLEMKAEIKKATYVQADEIVKNVEK